jgi:capsid protein
MHLLLALMLSLYTQFDAAPSGLCDNSIAPAKFSYDATDSKDKRRTPKIYSGSEDNILDSGKRLKLTANSRDLQRNFAIAAWMIRRHLDYVATFRFHSRNGDLKDQSGKDLDDQVKAIIKARSMARGFDRAGRHNLPAFLRLAEARSVLDGDFGILRLNDGRVQGIEGDRIKNPSGTGGEDWVHGVRTDMAGAAQQYALWGRKKAGGLFFERTVSAANLHLLGYYDRIDQVRGVSLLAPGLNSLRDVYENFDYALAKAKIANLLGIKFMRKAAESAGYVKQEDDEEDEDDEGPRYNVSFGGGPWSVDMEPGEDVQIVESQQPSTQFQAYMQGVLMVALKSLDIPFSFYDESHTNFYGSRGAWLHYQRACLPKRARLTELLQWWTEWQLQLAVLDGELKLPGKLTVADLAWEWVPAGMPFWDPSKETNGNLQACGAGLRNLETIAQEADGDVYDNIDANARVLKYAKDKHGMELSLSPIMQPLIVKEADDA